MNSLKEKLQKANIETNKEELLKRKEKELEKRERQIKLKEIALIKREENISIREKILKKENIITKTLKNIKSFLKKENTVLINKKEKKEMLIIYMKNIDFNEVKKDIKNVDKIHLVYAFEKEKTEKLSVKEKFLKDEQDRKEEEFLNSLQKIAEVNIRTVKKPLRYIKHLEEKSPNHNVKTIINIQENKNKKIEKEYSITTKFEKGSNLILWDIENIPFKYISAIFSKLNVIDKLYIVSVQEISDFKKKEINKSFKRFNIEIFTGHDDSDAKIIELIKEQYIHFKKITIVSSDTDFVNTINFVLDENKLVKIIARDVQKKGILMRTKIDHPNLRIETI